MKDARVGPGAYHFADEQIIGLLVVRLGHQAAGHPGAAAAHERQLVSGHVEQRHTTMRQLVRVVVQTAMPHLIGQLDLGSRGNLDDEMAALLDQFPRAGRLVQHDGQLGRRIVQRAGPGRRHDVGNTLMAGGNKNGGAVVNEAEGLAERNRGERLSHGRQKFMQRASW